MIDAYLPYHFPSHNANAARQIGDKSRKCALWVKMKPEYSEQTEDMDVIVLAAGFANGKMRSGLLSKFLVGVAEPNEEGKPRKTFYPIARVSK